MKHQRVNFEMILMGYFYTVGDKSSFLSGFICILLIYDLIYCWLKAFASSDCIVKTICKIMKSIALIKIMAQS